MQTIIPEVVALLTKHFGVLKAGECRTVAREINQMYWDQTAKNLAALWEPTGPNDPLKALKEDTLAQIDTLLQACRT